MSFLGAVRIIRPLNGLISSLAVWISFLIAGGSFGSVRGILAAIGAFFFTGFANIINDIADIKIDRINQPSRPLPSQSISINFAYYESILMGLTALAFSSLLGFANLLIGILALIGMITYSIRLKPTPFWGNLVVSITAAMAFIYGGAANGNIQPTLLPAFMAFLLHLGREITKDIEDQNGDRKLGARTLPILFGEKFSRKLTAIVLFIFIIVTLPPFMLGYYGKWYIILVAIVDLVLSYIIIKLLFAKKLDARMLSWQMKFCMPIGICAVYFGSNGF